MSIARIGLKKASLMSMAAAVFFTGGRAHAGKDASRSSPQYKALVCRIVNAYNVTIVPKSIHSLSARGGLVSPLYKKPREYSFDVKKD